MSLIRRLALAATTAVGLALSAGAAQAHFIDGWFAQCTAVGTGTCTESTATGYARQQIWFDVPQKGISANMVPWTFGPAGVGAIAGHAVYTLPTGGSLEMVMPYAAAHTFASGHLDQGDAGSLELTLTAMTAYGDGGFFDGTVTATTAFGTTSFGGALDSGVALTIARGILSPP